MILAYLHPGDLPLTFWIIPLLLLALFTALGVAALVAALKAIDRRSARKRRARPED